MAPPSSVWLSQKVFRDSRPGSNRCSFGRARPQVGDNPVDIVCRTCVRRTGVLVWDNGGMDDRVDIDSVEVEYDPFESRVRDSRGRSFAWCEAAVEVFVAGGVHLKGMNYTKPELRERLKRRIMAGDKGGRAGQWSARKAQLLAQAYRKAGGGYRGGKSKRQRSLSKWTREEWTTSDGKPARRDGGTTRYLPKKAWRKLSTGEREATNRKKREGSREGRQFVANTERAKKAGRRARGDGGPEGKSPDVNGVGGGRREPITGDRKPQRPTGNRY